MQAVLHELEIFHNYHVTECTKNVPNAHGETVSFRALPVSYNLFDKSNSSPGRLKNV